MIGPLLVGPVVCRTHTRPSGRARRPDSGVLRAACRPHRPAREQRRAADHETARNLEGRPQTVRPTDRHAADLEAKSIRPGARVGREVTTGGAGYVENYVRVASRSVEALWQTVETRLGDAITACLSGSVFDEPRHVETVKDALALHFARSLAVKQIHEDAVRKAIANSVARIPTERLPRMRKAFVEGYGREPSDDELDDIERRMSDGAKQQLDVDAMFGANVPQLFEIARGLVRNRALEVAYPAGGAEFLIGDSPASLCWDAGSPGSRRRRSLRSLGRRDAARASACGLDR